MAQTITTTRITRYEFLIVSIILGLSWLLDAYNILELGYAGQDYQQHSNLLNDALQGVYRYGPSNPPGLYFLGATIATFSTPVSLMENIAHVCLGLNLIALIMWYLVLRKTCMSAFVRMAAILVLAFLPVRNIASVVFAGDALGNAPTVLIILLLVAQCRCTSIWLQIPIAILNGVVWSLAVYTKYTFFFLPAGVAIFAAIWLLSPQGNGSRAKLVLSLAFGAILPLLVGSHLFRNMRSEQNILFTQTDRGVGMPWRDVFLIKPEDMRIFQAPEFTCDRNMDAAIGLSYPSLAHLGVFSDIWNFFQEPGDEVLQLPQPLRTCFPRRRSELAKFFTPISIVGSLPISILVFAGIIYQACLAGYQSFRKASVATSLKLAILCLCLAICLPPILRLPLYNSVYTYGYWTPRLILPGLLGLIVLGFSTLDEWVRERAPWLEYFILGYSIILAFVYALIL